MYALAPVDSAIDNAATGGWALFTTHMEKLCEFMEKCIWPVDPDADIAEGALMPFRYETADGKEDENVLKTLLVMLTLGLQGQAFQWKYKMDFDVAWIEEQKAYVVFLNSIRRMWNRGLDENSKPADAVSETPAPESAADDPPKPLVAETE